MSSKTVSKGRSAAVPTPTKAYDATVQLDNRIFQIPNSDLRTSKDCKFPFISFIITMYKIHKIQLYSSF